MSAHASDKVFTGSIPQIYEQYHAASRHATLLQCDGYVQRQGQVVHVLAKRLFDRSDLLRGYDLRSRDFH